MAITKGDAAPLPSFATPSTAPQGVDSLGLTESDYALAAHRLGCEIASIRAAAEVESSGRGYLPDGRPTILFEAHIFHRLTKGRFADARDRYGVPLSVPSWNRALYGKGGVHQYERLEDAMRLDEKAAVMACSWGLFQVMGFNFASLGFPDVDTLREFIESTDEPREHLELFVQFVLVNGLDDELRARDWKGFARGYNGVGYAANKYDTKLAAAYAKYALR
jgi:hypothetical protein